MMRSGSPSGHAHCTPSLACFVVLVCTDWGVLGNRLIVSRGKYLLLTGYYVLLSPTDTFYSVGRLADPRIQTLVRLNNWTTMILPQGS
ncbi:hypothetical protein C8Q74DRAFT_1293826 [Fomes fomentarius]|nr:hypothetical protein C8Q74DRAFT_1293826 [Fomes fomentarius]